MNLSTDINADNFASPKSISQRVDTFLDNLWTLAEKIKEQKPNGVVIDTRKLNTAFTVEFDDDLKLWVIPPMGNTKRRIASLTFPENKPLNIKDALTEVERECLVGAQQMAGVRTKLSEVLTNNPDLTFELAILDSRSYPAKGRTQFGSISCFKKANDQTMPPFVRNEDIGYCGFEDSSRKPLSAESNIILASSLEAVRQRMRDVWNSIQTR